MNLSLIGESLGMSRQNIYKTYLHGDLSKEREEEQARKAICLVLSDQSGLSGSQARRELTERGIHISRDRFYRIVNRNGLTYNSRGQAWKSHRHKLKASPNLVANRTFRRSFEVVFADYTEIKTEEGSLQLLLLEDLFSRSITAYRVSDTCKAGPVVEALEESMALRSSLGLKYPMIFHTDRGSEFVNHAVRNTAAQYGILLSNTGIDRCYENSYMESLNKTLKHTFGLRVVNKTKLEAEAKIAEVIERYNTAHKHGSLGKRVPHRVLMSYTAKKNCRPEVNRGSCHPASRVARTYSKSLSVKVKKNRLDKKKKVPK